jgi:hypothetical protein
MKVRPAGPPLHACRSRGVSKKKSSRSTAPIWIIRPSGDQYQTDGFRVSATLTM